ncbi:MAG: hypothetical protein ACYDHY_15370 [Acidiferrobacterales bacterium]
MRLIPRAQESWRAHLSVLYARRPLLAEVVESEVARCLRDRADELPRRLMELAQPESDAVVREALFGLAMIAADPSASRPTS